MPEDRDAALVWLREHQTRCPMCGTWDWEWEENPDAWFADSWRCEGCRRREHLTRDLQDRHKHTLDGLQVRLFRSDREED